MSPRVMTPATVRVTGDLRTCSSVLGGSFPRRGTGAGSECPASRAPAASFSSALSRSTAWAYFRT